MLKAITTTASSLLTAVSTSASAVNEVAATVESLASTAHSVADKWGEHTLENIDFTDDDDATQNASGKSDGVKLDK